MPTCEKQAVILMNRLPDLNLTYALENHYSRWDQMTSLWVWVPILILRTMGPA